MKLKILVLILIGIFYSSCSSQKQENIFLEKFPNWYLNPVSNDLTYLYGIGEGENLDEATKNALVSISSNLSLSINSNSTSKKESFFKYREYVSKEYLENINSNTENLTFNNYEVINFHKQRYNKFLAQVRVEKTTLIESLKNEFKLLYNDYTELLRVNKNKDFYSKYFEYMSFYEKLKTYINKNQILKNIDSSYDSETLFSKIRQFDEKIKFSKSKISFDILEKDKYPIVSSKLKEYLTNNGFEFKNNGSYKIDIQSKIDSKNARGIFIVNNTITINILYQEKQIKSQMYETKGVSSNSEKNAINASFSLLDLKNSLIF